MIMPHYNNQHRGAVPPELPSTPHHYPGVNPYGPSNVDIVEASSYLPYPYQPQATPSLPAAIAPVAEAPTKTGGLSMPNLGEIKGMIDRLGGLDGIMGHIGRFQKVMSSVQQFAPMAKLLMGSLPGFGKAAAGLTNSQPGELDEFPRRRKSSSKRRTNKTTTGKRSSSKGKRRTPTSTRTRRK